MFHSSSNAPFKIILTMRNGIFWCNIARVLHSDYPCMLCSCRTGWTLMSSPFFYCYHLLFRQRYTRHTESTALFHWPQLTVSMHDEKEFLRFCAFFVNNTHLHSNNSFYHPVVLLDCLLFPIVSMRCCFTVCLLPAEFYVNEVSYWQKCL